MERQSSAFSGTLVAGTRPALLVVDVVRAYLEPQSPLYTQHGAGALDEVRRLVNTARECNTDVIWTNVEYEESGRNGGLFYKKVPGLAAFVRGNPLGRFPEYLQPAKTESVVTKQFPSAFFGTGLAQELHAAALDTLLICGFSTSGCVRATALDALCNGLVPLVVADASADTDLATHVANLSDLGKKYAEIITTETAIGILRRT